MSISLFGDRVFVHFIALIDTRFDAAVPNIRETSGGRCGTYNRGVLLSDYFRDSVINSKDIVDYLSKFLLFFLFLKSSFSCQNLFGAFTCVRVVQELHPSARLILVTHNYILL